MDEIPLPQPVFDKCGTVFEALKNRRTSRSIGDKPLPLQVLADILWAAQGTNRKHGPFGDPGRTAGSASNSQEIRLYVALKEGTYLYEPDRHALVPVTDRDVRPLAIGKGQGPAGANAPVRLIYVADIDRFNTAGFQEPGLHDPETQKSYYFVDAGLIAGNVYLAASSLGLSAWFHNCNKEEVAKELNLGPKQRPLFGQTVGHEE